MSKSNSRPDPRSEKLQFLGMVSHELKTPLNAIIGFSDMIRSEMLGPVGTSEYREFAEEIRKSGVTLLKRIEDLIAASRAWDGASEHREAHVDIPRLVAAEIERHEGEAKQLGVVLQNLVDVEAGAVWGDAKAIGQALGAIIDNAVKFAGHGGLVTVEQQFEADGALALLIADTGPGIAPDMTETVFGLLSQVDDRLAREHEGMGLGLYLANAVMRRHGGRVGLESMPGEGARFRLVFPAAIRVGRVDDDLTVMSDDEDGEAGPAFLELTYHGISHRVFRDAPDFVIGRQNGDSVDVDLVLNDQRISRPHARIVCIDGAFHFVDESRRGSHLERTGEAPIFLQLDASPALSGAGRIYLGDKPDAQNVVAIDYRVVGR